MWIYAQHLPGDSRAGLGPCHLCHLCPGWTCLVGLFLPGETSVAKGIPLGSGIQEGSELDWDCQETRQLLHSHPRQCCLQMEYRQCQQNPICTLLLFEAFQVTTTSEKMAILISRLIIFLFFMNFEFYLLIRKKIYKFWWVFFPIL